ncbi:MAG: apolipoprotein N-acyltransferase [Candidatus Fonsibacter sp.]|nr:apolipoprotein N-acyltransferase [Candidatus Fonsibacter sp.]
MSKKNIFSIYIFLLLLGSLSSFSLPPYNFIFINFITYSFFLYLIILFEEKKVKLFNFFFLGFAFGYGYFASSLYWVSHSLTFDKQLTFLIPVVIFSLPALLAVFYGFAVIIIHSFIKRDYVFLLIFSISLSVFEYLRGILFTGFSWNLISYTWSFSLENIQILKFIGTYTFNFFSILIFSIYFNSLWPVQFKKILINSVFIFIVLISNYLFGKIIIKNTEFNYYKDVKVKIVQPNIDIAKTWGVENEKRNLNTLLALSKVNKDEKTLIVWPEGMIQQTNPKDLYKYKEYFNKNFSKNHFVVLGVTNPSISNNKINFYNSLVVLNNNAEIVSVYNKIKLVPFGEFIPFENLLAKWGLKKITFGYSSFSSGIERKEIRIFNNLSFLPLLCYEIIYSGDLKLNSNDYNLIINISEDGWFGDSIGPYQHLVHAIFRAVEQGVPIVRSTNKGMSVFISPNGKIMNSLELNKSGFIDLNLFFLKEKTLFSMLENYIFYFIILLSIIFIIALRKLNKNG